MVKLGMIGNSKHNSIGLDFTMVLMKEPVNIIDKTHIISCDIQEVLIHAADTFIIK